MKGKSMFKYLLGALLVMMSYAHGMEMAVHSADNTPDDGFNRGTKTYPKTIQEIRVAHFLGSLLVTKAPHKMARDMITVEHEVKETASFFNLMEERQGGVLTIRVSSDIDVKVNIYTAGETPNIFYGDGKIQLAEQLTEC